MMKIGKFKECTMAKKVKRPKSCEKKHKFHEVSKHSDLAVGYCECCKATMWGMQKVSLKTGEIAWFFKTGLPFSLKDKKEDNKSTETK